MQNKIWVTSDTHYNHKNICRGCSDWNDFDPTSSHQETRDFNTLKEMNDAIIDRINALVMPDDELWHLGDWSFGGKENIAIFRNKINCKNIHLVYGNHDQHIEKNKNQEQSLFSSVQYYKELSINKTRIVLSHFAFRVWNKSHKGSIHLYGHSHGTLTGFGRSMDVGVDTNNLCPYDLEAVIEYLKSIPVEIIDHHNENTN